MKILKVIHGYPMRYNAGSEVYSQTLCHGLAERHEVHVFTREEDAFAPTSACAPSATRTTRASRSTSSTTRASRIATARAGIDQRFAEVLDACGRTSFTLAT
jgi:hypothetical protein